MRRILLTLGLMISAVAMTAQTTFETADFKYLVISELDKTAEIIEFTGKFSKTLSIPNSVENDGTIYDVTRLRKDAIRNSGSDVENLKTVIIGNYLESLPEDAFYRHNTIESVHLGSSVKEIGPYAFYYCTALKSINIPSSVTSVGKAAFGETRALKSISFPVGVTEISDILFIFSGVETMEFKGQVTSMGSNLVGNVNNLLSLTMHATTPPDIVYDAENTYANTFPNNVYEKTYLHVPVGCANAYKNNPKWAPFKNIIADLLIGYCANPTIVVNGADIKFECKTPGVTFHSTVTPLEVTEGDFTGSNIKLNAQKYQVTVYASKGGYYDSETVTETITVATGSKVPADVNQDNVVNSADVVSVYNYIIDGE